jgi:hypothetical protein
MAVYRLNSHGSVSGQPLSDVREALLAGWQLPELVRSELPSIVGLHCPISGAEASCEDRFVLFLAGAAHFEIVRGEDGYAVRAIQFGNFAEDETVFEAGGDFAMAGASGVAEGRFYPWRPAGPGRSSDGVKLDWLMAPAEISGVVVEPPSGGCPETITLRVPAAALVEDPKGAEIVEVDLFDGPVPIDYQTSARSRPRELVTAVPGPVEHEFVIRVDPGMLDGAICSSQVIGMAVRGSTGVKIAGYRILP